jgi:hypothetical protein
MRRWLSFAFALLLSPLFALAAAAPNTLITNIAGRTTISLKGAWPAIVDPIENGLGNKFYEDARPKDESDRVGRFSKQLQNKSRALSWISRPGVVVSVMVPNCGVFT